LAFSPTDVHDLVEAAVGRVALYEALEFIIVRAFDLDRNANLQSGGVAQARMLILFLSFAVFV